MIPKEKNEEKWAIYGCLGTLIIDRRKLNNEKS